MLEQRGHVALDTRLAHAGDRQGNQNDGGSDVANLRKDSANDELSRTLHQRDEDADKRQVGVAICSDRAVKSAPRPGRESTQR